MNHYSFLISPWMLLIAILATACGSRRSASGVPDQKYSRLVEQARAEEGAGRFARAADFYRMAFDRKPQRTEVAYRAAQLYGRVYDYARAADAYRFLEAEREAYPLAGLYYGRALKQNGRYDQAQRVLRGFVDQYTGADRTIVNEIVANELEGIFMATAGSAPDTGLALIRPGLEVNGPADEYGPVAAAGGLLYFTGNAGGQARLYQSYREGDGWTKATLPPGFPIIARGSFGTGSLSPDGRTFYFTICSDGGASDQSRRCEIFRGRRSVSGSWSQPQRVEGAVNLAGFNNAYPYVTIDDGREVLYFASDRDGGMGGMDLYRCSRAAGSDDAFTAPANLGSEVNTISDEITPAYLPSSGRLFFASEGHPGFGGLDVFESRSRSGGWTSPVNPGRPINSRAEDYGYTPSITRDGAYLTSNRLLHGEKETTLDTDILYVARTTTGPRLQANAYAAETGEPLPDVTVSLFEAPAGAEQQLVTRRVFPAGQYALPLQPGMNYRVVIEREGFRSQSYRLSTKAGNTVYGQPIFLEKGAAEEAEYPRMELPPDRYPEVDPAPASPPAETTAVPETAYRIQIIAVNRFNPQASRYDGVRHLPELRAEPIPDSRTKRVTIGYFTEAAEALATLAEVRTLGFPSAYIVRYDNGERYGRVNLDRGETN